MLTGKSELKKIITLIGQEYPDVWFLQKVMLFVGNNFYRSNPEALIHALNTLLVAKRKGLKIVDPLQYCEAVLKVENGNYNERLHVSETEKIKKKTGFTSIKELFADMPH